jgi:hypothetical protein
VRPEVVVELLVDPAVDGPRWRRPARFVRLRPDLHPTDLIPTTEATITATTTTALGSAAAIPRPRHPDSPPARGARQVS